MGDTSSNFGRNKSVFGDESLKTDLFTPDWIPLYPNTNQTYTQKLYAVYVRVFQNEHEATDSGGSDGAHGARAEV
jgi:hypothetical protein